MRYDGSEAQKTSMTLEEAGDQFLNLHSLLGAERVAYQPTYQVFTLDLSTVFRHFYRPAILIFTTPTNLREAFRTYLIGSNVPESDLLAIVLCETSGTRIRSLREEFSFPGLIFLYGETLLKRGDVREIWRSVLLQYASIEQISPYRLTIAARGNMFFGRKAELSNLIHSRGCAFIYGPRRIGKTSVALQLSNQIRERHKVPLRLGDLAIHRSSYIDTSSIGEHIAEELWGRILKAHGLDPRRFHQYARRTRLSRSKEYNESEANAFESILYSIKGEITIILDEVDGWITREAEHDWPTLHRLRAMADVGRAKVVLVGYETLKWAVEYHRFPFALRGEIIHLGPLSRRDLDDLVTLPLSDLRLQLEPRKPFLQKIWSRTSGFPHLAQDICARLVHRAIQNRKQVITLDDLEAVTKQSRAFEYFTRGVINGDFPLAEAICYATIIALQADSKSLNSEFKTDVSLGRIRDVLSDANFEFDNRELQSAISCLELRWILAPVDVGRTSWTWVNQHQYGRAKKMLFAMGVDRVLRDLAHKHASLRQE